VNTRNWAVEESEFRIQKKRNIGKSLAFYLLTPDSFG
jgi:hypothetical protein